MRRCAVFVLASALAALSQGAAARSYTDRDCLSETTPSVQRIEACSTLLTTETDDTKRALYLDARSGAYFKNNSFVRSLADTDRVREITGDNATVRYHIAINYEQLEYYARAEPEIEAAIRMGMHSAEAYAVRATIYARQARFGDALQDLELAILGKPDFAGAYEVRAFANLQSGEIERALADYDKAIALHPHQADLYYYRGRTHLALDQYDAAIRDLEEAAQLDPSHPVDEDLAEVRADMQEAPPPPANRDPKNYPARAVGHTHNCDGYYPFLSNALGEEGGSFVHYDVLASGAIVNVGLDRSSGYEQLDRAAVICVSRHWRDEPAVSNGVPVDSLHHRAVIEFSARHKNERDAQLRRGLTLAGLGRYDEAIAQYDALILAKPEDAESYFRRGLVKYIQGQFDAAIRDLDQAIRLKRNYEDAIAARELAEHAVVGRLPTGGKGI